MIIVHQSVLCKHCVTTWFLDLSGSIEDPESPQTLEKVKTKHRIPVGSFGLRDINPKKDRNQASFLLIYPKGSCLSFSQYHGPRSCWTLVCRSCKSLCVALCRDVPGGAETSIQRPSATTTNSGQAQSHCHKYHFFQLIAPTTAGAWINASCA